jgi:hypothetical protein
VFGPHHDSRHVNNMDPLQRRGLATTKGRVPRLVA